MIGEHICTVCFQVMTSHEARCYCGCRRVFLVALCCKGCDCGTFEEAHRES